MDFSRRALFAALSGAMVSAGLQRAHAGGLVVKVSLWDKGAASMDGVNDAHMGMAMPHANPDRATMGITLDAAEIPAGEITFAVTNDSGEFYHSFSIAPVDDAARELPYLAESRMLDEAAIGTVARSKELRPHASGLVTVNLQPGTYIAFCNIAGHYAMGMWTLLTVIG